MLPALLFAFTALVLSTKLLAIAIPVLLHLFFLTSTLLPPPHPLLNRNLNDLASLIVNTNSMSLLTNFLHQPPQTFLFTLKPPLSMLGLQLKPLETPTPIKAHLANCPTHLLPAITNRNWNNATIGIRQHTAWITTQIANATSNVVEVALEHKIPTRGGIDAELDVAQDGEEALFSWEKEGFGADGNLQRELAEDTAPLEADYLMDC